MRISDRVRPWKAPVPSHRARDVAIIGAGAAGMAAAATLRRAGHRPVLFDAGASVGGAWAGRYDSLRLNTVKWMSDLPGLRMPRSMGRWPTRDDMVEYLHSYAAWHGFDVRVRAPVSTILPDGSGWRLAMADGGIELASAVVVATGHARRPVLPEWAKDHGFEGVVMHSSQYVRPSQVEAGPVVVVGGGSSGGEIAVDLARGGREVAWSIRSAPHAFRREAFGVPTTPFAAIGDLLPDPVVDVSARLGEWLVNGRRDYLPEPNRTVSERMKDCKEPIVADGIVELIREGVVDVVGPVEKLSVDGVHLSDGAVMSAGTVVAATGFEPGLVSLVGHLGVLDPGGRPVGTVPLPGLGFIGYRIPLGGTLWGIGQDAWELAESLQPRGI